MIRLPCWLESVQLKQRWWMYGRGACTGKYRRKHSQRGSPPQQTVLRPSPFPHLPKLMLVIYYTREVRQGYSLEEIPTFRQLRASRTRFTADDAAFYRYKRIFIETRHVFFFRALRELRADIKFILWNNLPSNFYGNDSALRLAAE